MTSRPERKAKGFRLRDVAKILQPELLSKLPNDDPLSLWSDKPDRLVWPPRREDESQESQADK